MRKYNKNYRIPHILVGSVIIINRLTGFDFPKFVFIALYAINSFIERVFITITTQFALKLIDLLGISGLTFYRTRGQISQLNQLSQKL